jgi:hypothetical protein
MADAHRSHPSASGSSSAGGRDADPAASVGASLPFAAHPDHESADFGVLGIVAVRRETVDLDDLDNLVVLTAAAQDGQPGDGDSETGLQQAIVIERARGKSSKLLAHVYASLPAVVDYLKASTSALLREDAAILQFALLSHPASNPASVRAEAGAALRAENKMLRSALQLPAQGPVGPSAVSASVAMLSAAPSAGSRPNTVPAGATSSASAMPLSASPRGGPRSPPRPRAVTPGVLNDEADESGKPPLHSPLQWDTVTESAVNARTKYDAYGRRKPSPSRLDTVTQQHLVQRLHDQSVDSRKRRLHQVEEQMMRSLGLQERRVLSGDEEHELGVRLHDQQREYSKKVATQLKDKYLPEIPRRALTPDVQKASAVRMHDETMARAKKNLSGLVEQYMPAPEKKKLDPAAQKAMADRLSQKA